MYRVVIVSSFALMFAASAGSCFAKTILSEPFHKLVPNDIVRDGLFGRAVAIDSRVVLGAPAFDFEGEGGSSRWSVFAYDVEFGQQIATLRPDDGGYRDGFGYSMALDSGIAVLASVGDDDMGEDAGAVYLFDVGTGVQLAKLFADDARARDVFGTSVAIEGDSVVVGAQWHSASGVSLSGAAYVFDAAAGEQTRKLTPEDSATNAWFGSAVAVDSGVAIVGAVRDDASAFNSGAAYLFDLQTGAQVSKLVAEDGEARDNFGYSVAIDGGYAIVGATDEDHLGENAGAAYVFDVKTGRQLAKLLPTDGAERDRFGWSVAIEGNVAVVGALSNDAAGSDSGAAYLFHVPTGQQLAKLVPADSVSGMQFGSSVAMEGRVAVIGARMDDDQGPSSGSVYLFDVPASYIPEPMAAALALLAAVGAMSPKRKRRE